MNNHLFQNKITNPMAKFVTFDVRGTIIKTGVDTIKPSPMLTAWAERWNNDGIFIDENPLLFHRLLDFFRDGVCDITDVQFMDKVNYYTCGEYIKNNTVRRVMVNDINIDGNYTYGCKLKAGRIIRIDIYGGVEKSHELLLYVNKVMVSKLMVHDTTHTVDDVLSLDKNYLDKINSEYKDTLIELGICKSIKWAIDVTTLRE